jgi:hypothetical protein
MTKNGQFSIGEGFAAVARPPLRGPFQIWLRLAALGLLGLFAANQSECSSMNHSSAIILMMPSAGGLALARLSSALYAVVVSKIQIRPPFPERLTTGASGRKLAEHMTTAVSQAG